MVAPGDNGRAADDKTLKWRRSPPRIERKMNEKSPAGILIPVTMHRALERK